MEKNTFHILKHYFIYFIILFYNLPSISVSIFTYIPIKKYKLHNQIILYKKNLFFPLLSHPSILPNNSFPLLPTITHNP